MLAVQHAWLSEERIKPIVLSVLISLTLMSGVFALTLGGVKISLPKLAELLFVSGEHSLQHTVIWQIRLPRVLLAMVVGAALAACGAAMQAIFRNPLADPGLIGISSGAALGAIMTIVLGNTLLASFSETWGIYAVPIGAFLGCIGVCMTIYHLTKRGNKFTIISLLLAGIAINAIVGSVIGLLTLISTDAQLRDLTFWSMGSLGGNTMSILWLPMLVMILCICGLFKLSQPLNIYLLGEQQANHLGLNVTKLKKRVFFLTALCIGAAVSITGMIGFVGFIIPHIMRLLLGPDHKYLLPASILGGAIMLSLADLVARTIILPSELPIGLITSAIGGPFFLIMLLKVQKREGF